MELFSKSFLFCLLLKQVVANGCELATRDQQYVRITCYLKTLHCLMNKSSLEIISDAPIKLNYGWFVEMVNLEISSWVVLDKEETRWLCIHYPPSITYTELGSTFEILKLILEQCDKTS